MKIALVHDYIKEYGGAESVLETLSDIYPDADILTSVYSPQFLGPHRTRLENKWSRRIRQSWFSHIPFVYKLLSPLRFLSPLAFKSFDFTGYDLIITSATGAFFPNSLNKKSARLVCYCHTPPRYLYNLATARSLDSWFYKLVNVPLQITLHFYRLFDFSYAQNVDQFIANSKTTAARIQKFYRKDSIIINPPVDIPIPDDARSAVTHQSQSFYLTGGRLTLAKRYDIAILACNKLKLPLKVFGRGFAGYSDALKKIAGLPAGASAKAGSYIEFIGEITQDQKTQLMSGAKAFIFCSDNEDFGIAPVEAMAVGTPVVAYRSGGTTETVIDGKTGIFFDELTADSCVKAIQKLDKAKIKSSDCISQSQKFSKEVFIDKIKNLIKDFH